MKTGKNVDAPLVTSGIPEGKFCLVPVMELCAAWSAYRQGIIRFLDLRVWLAGREMLARRCTMPKGRTPRFELLELQRLVGATGGNCLRASMGRLAAANLVDWTGSKIEYCVPRDGSPAGLPAMLSLIANSRRKMPIPRRMIRYLAQCRKPALVATVLGICLRGLYYRSRQCHAAGTCKASWIAEAFGVDVRSVKRARRGLTELGWITTVEKPHWHRQRYGEAFVVNLAWRASTHSGRRLSSLPPRDVVFTAELSPPDSHTELPSELEHPEPPTAGYSGAQRRKTDFMPRLDRVTPADLETPTRTAILFGQAAARGLVLDTPSNRLNFFAAAARAKRLGRRNPPGFFAAMVHRGLWHHLSAADEDAARERLRQVPYFLAVVKSSSHVGAEDVPHTPGERLAVRDLIRRSLESATGFPGVDTSIQAQMSA